MQKSLFTSLILFPALVFGQNIQDQKVTVKYKQLPLVNINDGSTMYSVVNETPFLQKNQDSLAYYELAKQNYMKELETALESWRLQNSGGDRNYWAQMSNYENQINAGATGVAMPQPAANPVFSYNKKYPKKPFLLKEINGSSVAAGIRIEGFKQSQDAPVKVTLVWNGFERGPIKENKSGTGPTTRYKFEMQYKHSVTIKIEVPGKGLVINETIAETNGFKSYTTNEYKTKGDFKVWWIDNEAIFWEQRQSEIIMQNVELINNWLNEKVGFPNKQRTIEIYTVKSKDFDYSDYLNAYTAAQDGFLRVEYADKKTEANAKLQSAIDIWNKALLESNINDRKARIDAHVTAATYINIAQAYCWMGDYSNAELNANKALGVDIGKYNREARPLLEFIRFQKQRAEVN